MILRSLLSTRCLSCIGRRSLSPAPRHGLEAVYQSVFQNQKLNQRILFTQIWVVDRVLQDLMNVEDLRRQGLRYLSLLFKWEPVFLYAVRYCTSIFFVLWHLARKAQADGLHACFWLELNAGGLSRYLKNYLHYNHSLTLILRPRYYWNFNKICYKRITWIILKKLFEDIAKKKNAWRRWVRK